ncbi:MAG TPA: beta-ketoacyl synthase N-terminal-like domain-containing protein, partial [Actinomycetota bacterium]|nr:beta-ketoacyl synthase N-terminal-like domain-containing protein [Actinomycetota bacterium]
MTPVVVTGMGVVTPIGTGVEAFWDALVSGRSGAGPIEGFDASGYATRIACQVRDFDPARYMDRRAAARCDRFAQLGIAAGVLAREDAGLGDGGDRTRAGVVVGSGIGGLYTIEEQHDQLRDGGTRRV